MAMKHTRGPWQVRISRRMTIEGNVHQILAGDNFPAAFVPAWNEPSPEEIDGTDEALANAALIAAAPDLYEALTACIDLAWVETRDVHFDGTVMMSHGYNWDGWENCREELHFRGGSFAVWPNQIGGNARWSLYSNVDGGMWFEKYATIDAAKFRAFTELAELCPDHPASIAFAAMKKSRGEV